MKEPVLSTSRILMRKSLNYSIDESWVDWAIEMIEAGYESQNLYMLAGINKPYNQFELHDLTDKVLKDLKLDYSDKKQTTKNYAYQIITASINKTDTYLKVLREFKNIYFELDSDPDYQDLYLLYNAKEDLEESEMQWYWDGANRNNINQIISDYFIEWKKKYELENRSFTS